MYNSQNQAEDKFSFEKSSYNANSTSSQEVNLEILANNIVNDGFSQINKLMGSMVEYKELLMRYSCAIKEVRTKFEVLNTEFNSKIQRNPIAFIQTRLKTNSSIVSKLADKGLKFNIENVENYINDIAGIRIICSFEDDIYLLAKALASQDDISVICEKDYIASPKPNGYRSYHMIVSVPVFFSNIKRNMKVEVQIRTIAMDFWASLEHELKYKQEVQNPQEIVKRLKLCADAIASTDKEMLNIRKEIEKSSQKLSQEDLLMQKLKLIDRPINN